MCFQIKFKKTIRVTSKTSLLGSKEALDIQERSLIWLEIDASY